MPLSSSNHIPSLIELLAQIDVENAITESASSSPISVSPFNIKNFEAFLVRSHCDENYEFWKCCNYYLNHADESTFDFVRWNTQIYESFIQVNAPMECNLPEDIRKAYKDWYVDNIIPSRDIVLKARQHTLNLMSDAYRQFVRYVNTSTPPPPSPAVTIACDEPSGYFAPQQRDLKVRRNKDKFLLKRSLSTSNAAKTPTGATISTSSSSTTNSSSRTELAADTAQTRGPLGLLSKGKALVTKLRRKNKRPTLQSSSSTGSALPVYPPLKTDAADTEIDIN